MWGMSCLDAGSLQSWDRPPEQPPVPQAAPGTCRGHHGPLAGSEGAADVTLLSLSVREGLHEEHFREVVHQLRALEGSPGAAGQLVD